MFPFMEGYVKKGGNTVYNMVLHSILEKYKLNCYNKIFLFSDACGGQNRNYLVMLFFSLLAKKLEFEIQHLFPVHGHSFSQSDRNFGIYGKKMKLVKTIETEDEYVKLIEDSSINVSETYTGEPKKFFIETSVTSDDLEATQEANTLEIIKESKKFEKLTMLFKSKRKKIQSLEVSLICRNLSSIYIYFPNHGCQI